MSKHAIESIRRKHVIATNIIERFVSGNSFLMVGHTDPDEDCISGMVAFGLLVLKFDKKATIYVEGRIHEQHKYLIDICRYRGIDILRERSETISGVDTLAIIDTPKVDMVALPDGAQSLLDDDDVVRVEFDHHLDADSEYIGDPEYALVDEASSACELIGYTALKLAGRAELLDQYRIDELLSRNFILAVLTGIIGDSKMGKYLKSRKELRFYNLFSSMFNELLAQQTTNAGNLENKEQVFEELIRLSGQEQNCYSFFMQHAKQSNSIGYVVLGKSRSLELSVRYDHETIVSVSRSIADTLAEQSGKLSLIGYYQNDAKGHLVQFRIRRSQSFKQYDVRRVIDLFDIENGGGHEGAIGFRFHPTDIPDIREYVAELIEGIEKDLEEQLAATDTSP